MSFPNFPQVFQKFSKFSYRNLRLFWNSFPSFDFLRWQTNRNWKFFYSCFAINTQTARCWWKTNSRRCSWVDDYGRWRAKLVWTSNREMCCVGAQSGTGSVENISGYGSKTFRAKLVPFDLGWSGLFANSILRRFIALGVFKFFFRFSSNCVYGEEKQIN